MKLLAAIAIGGAIGALARHFTAAQISHWLPASAIGLPIGILACNIIGSAVMGAVVEAGALFWSMSPETRAFIATGLLGAFTTFSTFSLEAVMLAQHGRLVPTMLYIGLSVVLSVGALFGAMRLVRVLAT